MRSQIRPALVIFLSFAVLTGLIYPLAVTAAAQALFPFQANGSIILRDGRALGSELVAQPFDDPRYFWSRPSAAGYNAAASSGSNLGPNNPALREAVQARVAALKAADPGNSAPIPVELVTASASGLDPHISLEAAYYQVSRISKARNLNDEQVIAIIARLTEKRQFLVFGMPRVNVLLLNITLDAIQ